MTQKDELLRYAEETYGTQPEYLWARDPDSGILRHPVNRKWFAAVLRVSRERLGLGGEGDVDILDIKCDPLLMGSLLLSEGFLPGYHMNKKHWLTVLLDGTVPTQDICGLLDMSYDLTKPKIKGKK